MWNLNKLGDLEGQQKNEQALEHNLREANIPSDLETPWKRLEQEVKVSADKSIGKYKPSKMGTWFDGE